MIIYLIYRDLRNCLRSVGTIVAITERGKNSLKVIFTTKFFVETVKAAIFRCCDVFLVQPPQDFQVQAQILIIRPVFPDCLSVSYDYLKNQSFLSKV